MSQQPLKCSVKDCVSTLYACGLTIDEDDMIHKSIKTKKKSNEKKSGTTTNDVAKNDDIKQPSIVDKDYIVFRFKDDGGIDLVEETSPQSDQDHPIDQQQRNKKALKELMLEENSESLQFRVNEDGFIILDDEGEDKRSTKSSKELGPSDENGGGDEIKDMTAVEEDTKQKALSESTLSDSSSGSFAFPIMNTEIEGSPERMPKSNEHHKIERTLKFTCCYF